MRQTRAFGHGLMTGADRLGEAADVRRRAGRPGAGAVVAVLLGGAVAAVGLAAVAGAAAGVAVVAFRFVAGV